MQTITRRALTLSALILGIIPKAHAAQRMVVTEYGVVLSTLPWAVALETGLLTKLNTNVDGFVTANGGGTAVRNMMASDLPFAELSVPAAIAAIHTGIDLRMVFSSVNNSGELAWVVKADSPIRTIEDLAGHKIAFTSPRSTTEMLLRMVLAKTGLTDKVQILPTGGVGAGVTALNQGAVDSAPVIDPLQTTAADRYHIVFRVNDYIPDICWNVGVTTPSFAAKNGDQLRHLIAARRQALDLMRNDLALAAKIYAKVWNIDESVATRVLPKFFTMNFWSPGNFDLQGLQTQLDGMHLVGLLDTPIDPATLIDRSFLPPDLRA